jgi:hypothetical protein
MHQDDERQAGDDYTISARFQTHDPGNLAN